VKIDVTLDDRDVELGISAFKAKFPAAIRRAVERASVSAKAEMAKSISADTGLPSRFVKDQVKTSKLGAFGIQLEVSGKRIPLIAFGARGPEPSRGRGAGVSYKLPTGRGRLDHGFIATMPGGHRGVFVRKGARRLPIKEEFGPSLAHAFVKYLPDAAARAKESLIKNLRSEISFAMKR
jgi:hypothetical protein